MSSPNVHPIAWREHALAAIFAAVLAAHGSAQEVPEAGPDTVTPPVLQAPSEEPQGEPNLKIVVEGNRRWCVRKSEPVWPAKPKPARASVRRGRTRRPFISSLAYAYYVVARAEDAPPAAAEPAVAAQSAPAGSAAETSAEAAPAPGATSAGAPPPPVAEPQSAPAAGGDGMDEEMIEAAGEFAPERDAEEDEGDAGVEDAGVEAEAGAGGAGVDEPPFDPDLHLKPGAVLLSQSPVLRTLARRRVQLRGQPPKLQPFWDNTQSCTQFPSHIPAWLPPGRYTLQVSFDVFMRNRRGWRHVQVARIEGVEVREGALTEIRLRVNTDGYVEVSPEGRVVEFLEAGAGAVPAGAAGPGPQTAPGGGGRR